MKQFVVDAKKAVAAFLVSGLAWATAVVASPSASITSGEWIGLAGVVVTTLTVYVLKNGPSNA